MEQFAKAACDICGKETTLPESHALADGNICLDCAEKLSPLFKNYQCATVEQIQLHLAYREENRKKLEAFPRTSFITAAKRYTSTLPGTSWSPLSGTGAAATPTSSSFRRCGRFIPKSMRFTGRSTAGPNTPFW